MDSSSIRVELSDIESWIEEPDEDDEGDDEPDDRTEEWKAGSILATAFFPDGRKVITLVDWDEHYQGVDVIVHGRSRLRPGSDEVAKEELKAAREAIRKAVVPVIRAEFEANGWSLRGSIR
jgi:hypothetical protein